MYLSRLHMTNWRSYADATFDFKKPTERRPVTLIGAMNGSGKTSFLIALYLGLFGRYGLRHCEGFRAIAEDDINSYRKAISKFRRNVAEPDQPTRVELTFTPTLNDKDEDEVRIVRQWWFTGANQPKPGEGFEELVIQIGDKMIRASDPTLAQEKIEKSLFPAHVTPAFFFDGEQAQALIETSGDAGIRRAVEVMFGSKVVSELAVQIGNYLQKAHANAGGKRKASEKQTELNAKIARRTELNETLGKRQGEFDELDRDRNERVNEREILTEKLTRLGGSPNADVRKIQDDFVRAETERREAEKALIDCTRSLGLPLAVTRFEASLRARLNAEERLEKWEGLMNGTLAKEDQVMAIAIPEPAELDPLLGNLSATTRANVRARFAKALEAIYNPKDPGAADDYRLGHVRGEMRTRLLATLGATRSLGGEQIKGLARSLRAARDTYDEAKSRQDRLSHMPAEAEEIRDRLKRITEQLDEAFRRICQIENEVRKLKSDLHDLNAEIEREQNLIAQLEPEQRRIAIAERVNSALQELVERLKPTTTARVEEAVTRHFTKIADDRFGKARVTFRDGEPKLLGADGEPESFIGTMSGFERRSFGLAFSLALAEITQRRIPLVIDTPLGNADSKYRLRTLKALTKFDSDQIIILTHDCEVTDDLLAGIEREVGQKFLVEFDAKTNESLVRPNRFFEE